MTDTLSDAFDNMEKLGCFNVKSVTHEIKEFIKESLDDFDLTCVKAGDLPKDMNVTAFKDVLNAYNRFKKRAGEQLT